MKKLCIYHANCADGFAAATIVRMALGSHNVEFHPGVYQQPPPDVTGRDVLLVDFSYKRDVLIKMAQKANSIIIIDHHRTAADNLINLPNNVEIHFDTTKCAAVMTWEYFHAFDEMPKLLQYIQDRDLWEFKLADSLEIMAYVSSYKYEFHIWEELFIASPKMFYKEGKSIWRKQLKDINEFIAVATRTQTILKHSVPVLNVPYFMASDAGHILSDGEPFAACYWDGPNGRTFSLRSREQGLDVAIIAEAFGGGGHKHAAGFCMPFHRLRKLATGYKPNTQQQNEDLST